MNSRKNIIVLLIFMAIFFALFYLLYLLFNCFEFLKPFSMLLSLLLASMLSIKFYTAVRKIRKQFNGSLNRNDVLEESLYYMQTVKCQYCGSKIENYEECEVGFDNESLPLEQRQMISLVNIKIYYCPNCKYKIEECEVCNPKKRRSKKFYFARIKDEGNVKEDLEKNLIYVSLSMLSEKKNKKKRK